MDARDATEASASGSRGVEQQAAAWLARRDGGAWSEADASALGAWLDASPHHRVAFLRLQAAWEECGRLQALGAGIRNGPPPRGHWNGRDGIHPAAGPGRAPPATAEDPADAFERVVFAARRQPSRAARRARTGMAAAASLFLALTLAGGVQRHVIAEASTHSTSVGQVERLPLADGSTTVLGSGSRIDVRLSRAERRIDLRQGEAFFEAASDRRRPFVVIAGERRVVAVGTRFSVRRDGPDLKVVVTEGSVRLESAPGAGGRRASALLPAGTVARATSAGVLVQTGSIEAAERLVGWQDGMLAFRDTPLAEAAAEFNRYSARRIEVADATAGALRIGGSFRWSNAEGFVRLLEQGFPVRAEYHPDRIVLRSDPPQGDGGISPAGSSR